MNVKGFSVILVYTTTYAIHAEKLLNNAGINTKLIPVPRHLSSDCGVCVRIPYENVEAASDILSNQKLPFEGIYPIKDRA